MMRTAVPLALLLYCGAALAETPQADDANRPYRNGPLTADDFQAEPDRTQSYSAWTQTNFRHSYKYRYRTQNGETTVTLTEIEVWGVVARDKSWNRRQRDALLLDHEQGHFDITQIYALAAQASLQKRIDKGPALSAKAKTKMAAVKLLEERIQAAIQPYITDSLAVHREYDKETSNGNDVIAQAKVRREQKQRMEELLTTDKPLAP